MPSFRSCIVLVIFLIFSTFFANGNPNINRLLVNIQGMKHDSIYVDSLNELSYWYTKVDNQEAKNYAVKAKQLAYQLNYEKGIGDTYVRLGIIAKNNGNFEKALIKYDSALVIRKKIGILKDIASVFNNKGLCYYYQGDLQNALKQFQKGIAILKDEINEVKGHLYNSTVELYHSEGLFEKAFLYADSSFQVWNTLKDEKGKARLYFTKAKLHRELYQYDLAINNFRESYTIYEKLGEKANLAGPLIGLGYISMQREQLDEALDYYQQAEALMEYLSVRNKAAIYTNLGILYEEKDQYAKAIDYQLQALNIYQKKKNYWNSAKTYYEIGTIHFEQEQYNLAKQQFFKCLEMYELDEDYDPYVKAEALRNISKIAAIQNDYATHASLNQQYNELRDSIYFNRLDATDFQLELEEEKRKTAELESINTQNRSKMMLTQGLILIGGLLLFALFLYYRNRQQRYEILQSHLEIDDILREQELKLAYAKLEATDQTQKRIGIDLHDTIGAMLATTKLYFADFGEQLQAVKVDLSQHKKAVELLNQTAKEVRRISHDMQEGILRKFGLQSAVKDLADTVNDSNQIKVSVHTHNLKKRIPEHLEINIYKIVQELVANTLKHAKANTLHISLIRQTELINILVEDDGIGFDENTISTKGGVGLANIKSRIVELQGTQHIDTRKGKGTIVNIDIPIEDT